MHQDAGIVAGRRDDAQHAVVARGFALDAKLPCGKPHGRMKPIQGARHSGDMLPGDVAADDVRDLVREDRSQRDFRPSLPIRRDDDRRLPPSDTHRNCSLLRVQEPNIAVPSEAGAHF
jgi:hypothetical protein